MVRKKIAVLGILLGATAFIGCGQETSNNVIEVEMVSYKPEAVAAFEEIQNKFNESHENIHLTINSPNEAMTILKTRFIKEDYSKIQYHTDLSGKWNRIQRIRAVHCRTLKRNSTKSAVCNCK